MFNDLLLICSGNGITKRVPGLAKYKLKRKFEFDGLVITESVMVGEENARAFSLCYPTSENSMKIDLLARTTTEKEEWVHTISKALKCFNARKA